MEPIGLVLIFSFAILLALGIPLAFAIGISSLVALLVLGDVPLVVTVQRMFAGADSFTLMAVPLFMLAGELMAAGGISRRLVDFSNALVGHMHGGLAMVAVFTSMLFAGISGAATADTAAVGAILIPAMIRRGYRPGFASAVQASGGSVGVIIPPSIPMIVYGVVASTSIAGLFAGGYGPGLLIAFSLMGMAHLISRKRDDRTEEGFSVGRLWKRFKEAFLAILAPVVIVGGIVGGIFTPTESAVIAVAYGFVLGALVYKELRLSDLPKLFISSCVMSAVVMFVLATASIFGWIMARERVPDALSGLVLGISTSPIVILLTMNIVLLLVGTFMDTIAAIILLVPVLQPIAMEIGMDPIHFGVVVVVNLAMGMLTPPLGYCLFVSSSIAKVSLEESSRSILPFLLIMLIDLMIITYYPPLTTYLPGVLIRR